MCMAPALMTNTDKCWGAFDPLRARLFMRTVLPAALVLVFCAGCGTPDYHFTAYVGQQNNWTTSTGSYVKIIEDVPI